MTKSVPRIYKVIKTAFDEEDTYLSIVELPDQSLIIEGFRKNTETREFMSQRIRFTKGAIKTLTPILNEWLKK